MSLSFSDLIFMLARKVGNAASTILGRSNYISGYSGYTI